MVKNPLFSMGVFSMGRLAAFALLLAACSGPDAPAVAGPPGGEASLQSPPFAAPEFHAAPGQPTTPSAPQTPVTQADAMPFAAIAMQFDPGKQHLVWVIPPGLHGKGPWDLRSVVKHLDEVKFETTVPLKAVVSPGGSRPEYPAGYEVVRLTDDGTWAQRTAEIDKVIAGLIAQYGRGQGSLEMTNDLKLSVDPAYKKTYCVENKPADLRFYLEDDGVAELIRLDIAEMAGIIQVAVKSACNS